MFERGRWLDADTFPSIDSLEVERARIADSVVRAGLDEEAGASGCAIGHWCVIENPIVQRLALEAHTQSTPKPHERPRQ
jgi:hypothetical protein